MRTGRSISITCGVLAAWFAGAALAFEPVVLDGAPAQPDAQAIRPGLAPVYFYGTKFDHVREFYGRARAEGKPGDPLLTLNYRSGADKVLTSDEADWVGANIAGFIRLDTPGVYQFAFESNDGVRLEIAGAPVVEDPDVHADQFSDVGTVEIAEPGWYPIVIWYFEKWNTSTLRFLWKPPDAPAKARLKPVPGKALAHLPAG